MPKAWTEETDESDYDLIALTLDRMEAAVGAGQYRQAEQARLEAYAFFEFGPERRLRSFDPGLALDIEGLIWFGAAGQDGLATQIANRAPRREIRETRLALDTKLGDAAATLGDSANKATVVTNSAIIVFREGLEGVLILAAITAQHGRAAAPAPAARVHRRVRGPDRLDHHLGPRDHDPAVAGALRREARGGGRADRHRRAAADHELVLPQGLLVGVDRQVPPPAQALREAGADRLLLRAGDRPVRPRPHERVPRRVRDRAVPAVAAALRRHGDRASRARASGSR